MTTAKSVPDIVRDFLQKTRVEQMNLCTRGHGFDFEDQGKKWVPIIDHFTTRNDFHSQEVVVHTYDVRSNIPSSQRGVPLNDDYTLLLRSSAQFLSRVEVVFDHSVITRIELPDGTSLTGDGPRTPWREALECHCNYCEFLRNTQEN